MTGPHVSHSGQQQEGEQCHEDLSFAMAIPTPMQA